MPLPVRQGDVSGQKTHLPASKTCRRWQATGLAVCIGHVSCYGIETYVRACIGVLGTVESYFSGKKGGLYGKR